MSSQYLGPALFLAGSQIEDLATNTQQEWDNIPNVLAENDDFTDATTRFSGASSTYKLTLSQPDFVVPAGLVPVWMEFTARGKATSNSGGTGTTFVQAENGTRRSTFGFSSSGFSTMRKSGFLSDWGITEQDAFDIINGTNWMGLYQTGSGNDPTRVEVKWAKLEVLMQNPQTGVLSPPVVF